MFAKVEQEEEEEAEESDIFFLKDRKIKSVGSV
jgi:hypothetical protein